jgi:hypothetical protein
MIVVMKPAAPASYAPKNNGETRPFGKHGGAPPLIKSIQSPFVMLRFTAPKDAWLTARSNAAFSQNWRV